MKEMKNMIAAAAVTVIGAACALALTACGETQSESDNKDPADIKYKVSYVAGGGIGDGVPVSEYKAGTEITIAVNPFTYEDHTFTGWKTGVDVYKPGEIYIVPESDTVFTATWKEIEYNYPSFGKESYAYDRWGGHDMEITLDLDGANLCYVEIDGNTLYPSEWLYNDVTKCLVIKESYMLALLDGDYMVRAVTDSAESDMISCKLTVDNSVKTSFDDVREKNFRFGYDTGVRFALDAGEASITKLTCGDITLDPEYYTTDDSGITVSGEWLRHFSSEVEFKLELDNYDSYEFTVVPENIKFATDYDINTIHDTTASNTGSNPLYQYYDNVSIVNSPSAMNSGKALKITPNTQQVQFDCNGYFTLSTDAFSGKTTWRNGKFVPNKHYYISFDYMTEDTSVGTLVYKDPYSGWARSLLMGSENDGIVHKFTATLSGNELEHGLYLYAFFANGGGNVYVDNFFVVEFDGLPTFSGDAEYSDGNYMLDLDARGLEFTLTLDGEPLGNDGYVYDSQSGEITVKADALAALGYGMHEISAATVFGTVKFEFDKVDNRVVEIIDTTVNYASESDGEVKVRGSFSDGLELTSLTQKAKTYNKNGDGVYDGWNFAAADTQKNYAALVSLATGDENDGYITLPKAFLDLFWGDTSFIATFSNGKRGEFTVHSDVLYFTNYDDTTIFGYRGDNAVTDSPVHSGLNNGAEGGIENHGENGNKAFVVRSTQTAEDPSAFTVKFRPHQWGWFYTACNEGWWDRITFDYCISGLPERSVFLYIMASVDEDKTQNFFGDHDETDIVDGYVRVKYYLVADGKPHTFDSGWFINDLDYRMTRIVLPRFEREDGKYIMFDNYRIVQKQRVQTNFLNELSYESGRETPIEITIPEGVAVNKITVDGAEVQAAVTDGKLVIGIDMLDTLEKGSYTVALYTNCGKFTTSLTVTLGGNASLTEKSKNVVYGSGSVTLAGEFSNGVTVVSIKRRSEDFWDNTNSSGGCAVKSDGAMNPAYVTVRPDGLTLSAALVDQVYQTMYYTVEFSNGVTETFSLTSNLIRYSNYDETYLHQENGTNVESFQDTDMISIESDGGNAFLKYQPRNAKLGHSVSAINGGDQWNAILTFANRKYIPNEWFHYPFDEGSTVVVFFDYEVYDPDNKANYQFSWWDTSDGFHPQKITGKGRFTVEIPVDEMKRFFVNCPVSSPDNVEGTYMTIDNFGFYKKM